jgi:hypothetical protein
MCARVANGRAGGWPALKLESILKKPRRRLASACPLAGPTRLAEPFGHHRRLNSPAPPVFESVPMHERRAARLVRAPSGRYSAPMRARSSEPNNGRQQHFIVGA